MERFSAVEAQRESMALVNVLSNQSSDSDSLRVKLRHPSDVGQFANNKQKQQHIAVVAWVFFFYSFIRFSALKYCLFGRSFLKTQWGANGKSLHGNFFC